MQPSILDARRRAPLRGLPATSNGPFSSGCLLGLAPDGVCTAALLAEGAVSSYLPFSPLPCPQPEGVLEERPRPRAGRYVFCCTFRRLAAPGRYPASCPAVFGLSSPPAQCGTARLPVLLLKAVCSFRRGFHGCTAASQQRYTSKRFKTINFLPGMGRFCMEVDCRQHTHALC